MAIKHLKKEEFAPWVRRTKGLVIYGKSKNEIFAQDSDGSVLCERWDNTNFFYAEHWDKFVRRLKRKNSLAGVRDVWKLAFKYEISAHTPTEFPEIPKSAQVLPSYWTGKKEEK